MCKGKQRCKQFEQMLKEFCERDDIAEILQVGDCVAVVLDDGCISCLSHDPLCSYPTWLHIETRRDIDAFWVNNPVYNE